MVGSDSRVGSSKTPITDHTRFIKIEQLILKLRFSKTWLDIDYIFELKTSIK